VEHSIETLGNGITFVVLRNPALQTMVAMVGVKVGSRYEAKEMQGASHFIEHMMFKGTKKYPSSKALSEIIDARGGEHNAYTDKELTNFYVRMAKSCGDVAVDLVHDMIANSLFRTSDVEKERPVIQEEISGYDNNPDHNAWELSERVAYKGSGLEHPIAGSVESVTFPANSLRKFFRKHYVPSRMAVVLSGAVDDKLVATAQEKFSSIPMEEVDTGYDMASMPKGGLDFKVGNTDKIHFVIRLPGTAYGAPYARMTDILSVVLGGYMSARLFQSLRDKHGLCYGVFAFPHHYSDTGSLLIGTSLDRKNFPKALEVLVKELWKISKKGVTEKELQTVKDHIRGVKSMDMDRPMGLAADAILQLFMSRTYETPEEDMAKYQEVTLNDVNVQASGVKPTAHGMHIAVVGPKGAEKEVRKAYEAAL